MTSPATEKTLNALRRLPENRICGTCKAEDRFGFKNVCMKFKIFVCADCKSAHQAFSHKCKSVTMSNWSREEVELLKAPQGGNARNFATILAGVPASAWPTKGCHPDDLKAFVHAAYDQLVYSGQVRIDELSCEKPPNRAPAGAPQVQESRSEPNMPTPSADLLGLSFDEQPPTATACSASFATDSFGDFGTFAASAPGEEAFGYAPPPPLTDAPKDSLGYVSPPPLDGSDDAEPPVVFGTEPPVFCDAEPPVIFGDAAPLPALHDDFQDFASAPAAAPAKPTPAMAETVAAQPVAVAAASKPVSALDAMLASMAAAPIAAPAAAPAAIPAAASTAAAAPMPTMGAMRGLGSSPGGWAGASAGGVGNVSVPLGADFVDVAAVNALAAQRCRQMPPTRPAGMCGSMGGGIGAMGGGMGMGGGMRGPPQPTHAPFTNMGMRTDSMGAGLGFGTMPPMVPRAYVPTCGA